MNQTTKKLAEEARRFDKGQYPSYDKAYRKAVQQSPFLNNDSPNIAAHFKGKMGNKEGLKHLMYMLEGNDKGKRKKGKDKITAFFPQAKADLNEAKKKFQEWAEKQLENGHEIVMPEAPEDIPQHLQADYFAAQARFDVMKISKYYLKKKLKNIEEEEEQERKKEILKYGPRGDVEIQEYKQRPGRQSPERIDRVVGIDGQNVSRRSGIPYIDEPDSPYHLMPLYHYKQMAQQWLDEHQLNKNELVDQRAELVKKIRKEAYANGEQPPAVSPAPTTFAGWLEQKGITAEDYPAWKDEIPEIKDVLNEKDDNEETEETAENRPLVE